MQLYVLAPEMSCSACGAFYLCFVSGLPCYMYCLQGSVCATYRLVENKRCKRLWLNLTALVKMASMESPSHMPVWPST